MTTRYLQALRAISPALALYLIATGLVGFAFDGGVYAVLLNLFLVRMGYGPELVGVVNSAGTLAFALSSLPAGIIGERWGSRRAMLAGLLVMIAGCLLLPLANALPAAWRLAWLMLTMVGLYMGLALYFVNTAPYVMEIVGVAERTRAFSIQTALLSLAAFVGSLLGGFLPPIIASFLGQTLREAAPYGFALLTAGLALIPAFLALRASRPVPHAGFEETPHEAKPAAGAVAIAMPIMALLTLIALVRMLQVAGLAATNTFLNVYLDTALAVPTAQIGMIIAVGRLIAVPAALATSTLTTRFGNRNVVIATSLGTALAILPIALIPHWLAAGLGFLAVISLSWIRYAASIVYFLELVPPARRASVSGVTEMAAGVCFTIVTFGGGYLIASFGYSALFLTGAALTALSAVVFGVAFRGSSRSP